MTKNKLEKLFSKSMGQLCWCMKLHNNPLAHQNTPGDYIGTYEHYHILFECKLVTCKESKGRLQFKRLKQMHDLLAFERAHYSHNSYFVIAFYDNRWSKSEVYLIPAYEMQDYIQNYTEMQSINRELMQKIFGFYILEIEGGELKLASKLKQLT